jgi:hypothetical protein
MPRVENFDCSIGIEFSDLQNARTRMMGADLCPSSQWPIQDLEALSDYDFRLNWRLIWLVLPFMHSLAPSRQWPINCNWRIRDSMIH